MKRLTVTVKNVKNFVKNNLILYASDNGKRFFITLRAGPKFKRYIVRSETESKEFTKVSEAVRYFNE